MALQITDKYMMFDECVNRLIREYKEHGKLIIAYDFDYTIHSYRGENDIYINVMNLLRECRPYAKFIVYTCSNEERYEYIRDYLDAYNIPYDTINEPIIELCDNEKAKLYYNHLLDDRSGLMSAYMILKKTIETIQESEK